MKKYEEFGTVQIKLIPKKDNENVLLVKDTVNGTIIGSKHINYINKIGMKPYELYEVEYGVYTKDGKYLEIDFMKVYSYVSITASSSAPVLAKKPKTSANKPAWLRK